MTMITPSYLGETIEYSSLHACRSTLEDPTAHFDTVGEDRVERLDEQVAALEARVELPDGFVIPGGNPVAAALDLARTFVRRAERRAVSLKRSGELDNPLVIKYLNRCSDYLFLLARDAEKGAITPKGRCGRHR